MANDYYKTLGIDKGASKDEIKKAFHKLAHKYHPDKQGGDEARFKEVNEAYQVLSNDQKRQQYDTYGQSFNGASGGGAGFGGYDFSGFEGGAGFDFGDLNDIFSDFFGGGGKTRNQRGRDLSTEINISFSESVFGVLKKIVINKNSICEECEGRGAKKGTTMKKCNTCGGHGKVQENRRSILGNFTSTRICDDCFGSGEVPTEKCPLCKGHGIVKKNEEIDINVPAGIRNGEMIRLSGMGEAIRGGVSGDLYIKINVAMHKVFKREGNDLVMNLSIKLTDALLGAEYGIETLDGNIKVKIPGGVGIGEILRIKDRGVPVSKSKRGDLLIRLNIELPKKLSKQSKDLFEKLKEEGV